MYNTYRAKNPKGKKNTAEAHPAQGDPANTVPTCPKCGSSNASCGYTGRCTCMDCGAKFSIKK